MFQLLDTTYAASETTILIDPPGANMKLRPLSAMMYTEFNPRDFSESALERKLTNKEYAIYLYKGKWQNVLPMFIGKIPNDFNSKKQKRLIKAK